MAVAPWRNVDALQKLTKKQLVEKLRGAQLPVGTPPPPLTSPANSAHAAQKDWSSRKAEWVCSHCKTHNYVSRMDCRRCKQHYDSSMRLIAAGTPPPTVTRPPLAPTTNGGLAAPMHAPESVQAAEIALEAAKQAAAPQAVLAQWENEVQRRKALVEDTKVPPSLRSRLAAATAEANSAMHGKERAEKQLEMAHQQVKKADENLQQAMAAEGKAATNLKLVTAEVVPMPARQEQQDPRLAAEKEATLQSAHSLQEILQAYKEAAAPEADPSKKLNLESALQSAMTKEVTRAKAAEEARKQKEEENARMEAPQSVAAATPAMPVQASPQGERAGEDRDATMSDSKRALSAEEADALLQELEGMDRMQKRARLMAAVQSKPVEATQVRT